MASGRRRRVLRRLPRSGTKRSPWLRLTRWTRLGCWPRLSDCGARRRYQTAALHPNEGRHPSDELRPGQQRQPAGEADAVADRPQRRDAQRRRDLGRAHVVAHRAAQHRRLGSARPSAASRPATGSDRRAGRPNPRTLKPASGSRPDPVGARGTTSPQVISTRRHAALPRPERQIVGDRADARCERTSLGGQVHGYLPSHYAPGFTAPRTRTGRPSAPARNAGTPTPSAPNHGVRPARRGKGQRPPNSQRHRGTYEEAAEPGARDQQYATRLRGRPRGHDRRAEPLLRHTSQDEA